MRHSLLFDMQNDHILKKLDFGFCHTPKSNGAGEGGGGGARPLNYNPV